MTERIDIARARADFGYFAAAIGHPLEPWQEQSLPLDKLFTAIVAGRQLGKTRGAVLRATHWAMANERQRILFIGANDDRAKDAVRLLKELTDHPLLAGSRVDELASTVRFSNGSVFAAVPPTERQVRGQTVNLLICDEAQSLTPDLVYSAALPTITARPAARVLLTGTAGRREGPFYDICRRGEVGDGDISFSAWVSHLAGGDCVAPWITPSFLEEVRAALGDRRFSIEYQARWAETGDLLISRAALDQVTVDDRRLWPLDALVGPGRLAAGFDHGATNDHETFVALGRVVGESRFVVVCAHQEPSGAPILDFIQRVLASRAHFAYVVSETNGLGIVATDLLQRGFLRRAAQQGGGPRPPRWRLHDELAADIAARRKQRQPPSAWAKREPPRFRTTFVRHHVTGPSKVAAYGSLRLLIDRQQLLIPREAETLLRELSLLAVDVTQSGHERIEASRGHDDLADALAHALVPSEIKGRGWSTVLGDFAERPAPQPDSDAAGDPSAFQSVNNVQVTTSTPKTRPPIRIGRYTIHPQEAA